MKYINSKAVKDTVHTKGKRLKKSFLLYLDMKIEEIINKHIRIMGSRTTLNMEDSQAIDKMGSM